MEFNKLHAVYYKDYHTNSLSLRGLFRDENSAIMYMNDMNQKLSEKNGNSAPTGTNVVSEFATDIDFGALSRRLRNVENRIPRRLKFK